MTATTVAAFQSSRIINFPSRTHTSYQSRPTARRSRKRAESLPSRPLSLRHATTGWINADTLNFHDTIPNGIGIIDRTENDDRIDDGDGDAKIMYPSSSPVERLLIRDRLVYVKRDDLLHLPCSNVSGNKARKFLSLNNIPASEFPDAIVSYGGPQSNAMVALAAIVASKNAQREGNEKKKREDEEWLPTLEGEEGRDMFWQLDVSEDDTSGSKREKRGERFSMRTAQSSPSNVKATSNTNENPAKKRFIYYTKTMPRYLRKNPNGNLLRALALGMEVRTVTHDEYGTLFGGLHGGSVLAPADLDPPVPGGSLWIPQGGACAAARPGSDVLAKEILHYWSREGRGMPLTVCIPGGTCTTALLLHRSIHGMLEERRRSGVEGMDVRVVVIPCVGDDDYAMRQMKSLDRSVGGRGRPEDVPQVLRPRTNVEYGSSRRRSKGYFTFGEPTKAILQTFDELNEAGLFLDLLYGAPAFGLLLQHWKTRVDGGDCPIAGRQVLYVHTGGLEGIASQLTRYKHKGLIDARTIQIA